MVNVFLGSQMNMVPRPVLEASQQEVADLKGKLKERVEDSPLVEVLRMKLETQEHITKKLQTDMEDLERAKAGVQRALEGQKKLAQAAKEAADSSREAKEAAAITARNLREERDQLVAEARSLRDQVDILEAQNAGLQASRDTAIADYLGGPEYGKIYATANLRLLRAFTSKLADKFPSRKVSLLYARDLFLNQYYSDYYPDELPSTDEDPELIRDIEDFEEYYPPDEDWPESDFPPPAVSPARDASP